MKIDVFLTLCYAFIIQCAVKGNRDMNVSRFLSEFIFTYIKAVYVLYIVVMIVCTLSHLFPVQASLMFKGVI